MIYDCIVLCGGTSPERPVSLNSGFAVAKALHSLFYKVALLDPALGVSGLFTWPFTNTSLQKARFSNDLRSHFHALSQVVQSKEFDRKKTIFFNALHGTWGEDGRVQAILDTLECAYTGSDFASSALAMNKSAAKAVVSCAGVAVSRGVEVDLKQISAIDQRALMIDIVYQLLKIDLRAKFVVVKPTSQGSSIATERIAIDDHQRIIKAVKTACLHSSSALIELFIEGREFTAGVLGDRALPLVEIVTPWQFCDYEGKYQSEKTQYRCPVTLSKSEEIAIKSAALTAHNALGAKSFSRSDFRFDSNRKFYFLELNTSPGMTPRSLLPKAAKASGMGFERLCQTILLSARH